MEVEFYRQVTSHLPSLARFLPRFHGVAAQVVDDAPFEDGTSHDYADIDLAKERRRTVTLEMENLVADYRQASVMDLKLGTRLYDRYALPEKQARLDEMVCHTWESTRSVDICH